MRRLNKVVSYTQEASLSMSIFIENKSLIEKCNVLCVIDHIVYKARLTCLLKCINGKGLLAYQQSNYFTFESNKMTLLRRKLYIPYFSMVIKPKDVFILLLFEI